MRGIEALKRFDKRQLFRFFVDGRYQKRYQGWTGYEARESGSTQGMLNAYRLMLENFDLSRGISSHYVRHLHHTCMFNVYSTLSESSPGDLRYEQTGFKFFAAGTTLEFLTELLEHRKNDNAKLFHNGGLEKPARDLDAIQIYRRLMKRKRLQFNPWHPDLPEDVKRGVAQEGSLVDFYDAKSYIQRQFAEKLEGIIGRFNPKIRTFPDEKATVEGIARLIQEIELIHPFPDGNCRTLATLTNHLLLYHGLYPTILENPNYDGTYSVREYSREIEKGMECTRQLLKNPAASLFGYSINDSSPDEIAQFQELASELSVAIDTFRPPALEMKGNPTAQSRPIYLNTQRMADCTGGKWFNAEQDLTFAGVGTNNGIKKGYISFLTNITDWRNQGLDDEAILKKIERVAAADPGAIVIDSTIDASHLNLPLLVVDDPTAALRKVAVAARQSVNPKTVLVGGTVGKTGFKFQLYSCLAPLARTHAMLNTGNIKMPILYSLASLRAEDEIEIVEISGAAKYSWGLARAKTVSPDICVFTDINCVHMDIHQTIENLIRNKSSAAAGLREGGVCLLNKEAEFYDGLREEISTQRPDVKIMTFGSSDADAYLKETEFDNSHYGWRIRADIDGEAVQFFTPLFQHHAPVQSLGVLLAAKALGYSAQAAADQYKNLETFETMGRLFQITVPDGRRIVFYDQSLRGAIAGMRSAFKDLQILAPAGRIHAVIGGTSVEEDGQFTKLQHEEIADMVNASNIYRLYTTGPYLNYMHVKLSKESWTKLVMHSDDRQAIAMNLLENARDGDLIFVMGSAYLRMGNLGKMILGFGERKRLG